MEKLESTTLLIIRMRRNLIETFKMINRISNYCRHFFFILLLELKIHCQSRFKKPKSIKQLNFFCKQSNIFLEQIA